MSIAEKIIVIPYKKGRGGLMPGEMRQATNAAAAERIAASMASRFAGVGAYAVTVDTESGDMSNPRVLATHGEVPDFSAMLDAA